MTDTEYTPTTDAVRSAYVRNRRMPFTHPDDHRAEFDRWLVAKIEAEKAKAWDEGFASGHADWGENPYRKEQGRG